jgi:predicted dienelactone hydrolase
LAAHGFAVAALEHVGSNLQYRQTFLAGDLSDIVQPDEYISRSRDVTYLLDALETAQQQQQPWATRLDLQSIGLLGNSLGGTTALSVAGATFNPARLQQDCRPDRVAISVSFLLQCIAQTTPPDSTNLHDPRIKAVLAAYPLTSSLFGPEGIGQITVPTLIMGGSEDFIAPVAQDQIQPFIWLRTRDKYLALLTPGTHFSSSDDAYVQGFPPILLGPSTELGRTYLERLSVSFFGNYLGNHLGNHRDAYRTGLSEVYIRSYSQDPLQLYLIRSLTPEQLERAYGNPPPSPIIPPPITTKSSPQ